MEGVKLQKILKTILPQMKGVKFVNSPARIAKLCTPASADKQQREAAKGRVDTRVSAQLTQMNRDNISVDNR